MFFVFAVAGIRLTNALSSQKMTLYPVSSHRASIPTEKNVPHELKEDYPNGNMILREDYRKSFKKEVRWKDIKSFLRTESIGEVYPNYSNGEKDRYVCRPSRQNGVHDGFDRRKQAVKMADVFGIEKVWAAIYEGSRQHGDFGSKKSN